MGAMVNPQILTDQLRISQAGEREAQALINYYSPNPRIFRPSYGPANYF